jgi:carboxymethylenebutenolidase
LYPKERIDSEVDMNREEVRIRTPDGAARAFIFTPAKLGPWPAVLFFQDGAGIRPSLFTMAERLANNGYFVLLPDMYWRAAPYAAVNVAEVLKDEALRQATVGRLMATTDPERAMSDTGAFLDFLGKQSGVKGKKIGTTGYCMGGGLSLRAAAHYPDRVAAAGAFHAGRVVTDAPDSPHLLAGKIKARVLVAGADRDTSFTPEQSTQLKVALDAAKVDNVVTIYPGALHGYAVPDMPVFDPDAAERHWRELLILFDEVLQGA